MSDDVLITPASRKIEFKDNSGNVDGKIELDSSGNLKITSPGGGLELGDAASDIFVGNGTANIDIIFEQNGEIRGTTGRTVTLGQSDSNIAVNALNFTSGGNEVMTSASVFPSGTTTTGLPTAGALNLANPVENDNHVFHPYLNNDLGHFVERGGTYAWGGLSSNPSADATKTMFNASGDFCSINDNTISGSTYTLTLTNLPKGLSYSSYAGIVFCHDTFSPGSMVIETSTNNGSSWTTRLTDSSSKAVYACTFDTGGTSTNAIRFTLTAAPNSAQVRIQSITAYNYQSAGMENYFLPLDGGTVYGDVTLPDNNKLNFGTSSDLRIYHDGSNSIIEDVGTGSLQLKGAVNINGAYTLPSADGNNAQVLATNGSGTISFQSVGSLAGSGIQNVSDDTSPQLGGNLSTANNEIHLSNTSGVAIKTTGNLASSDLTILRASSASNQDGQYGFDIRYMGSRTGNSNSFALEMHNQTGTNVEAITALQDGKVGINKTAPTTPLHVGGDITGDGDFTLISTDAGATAGPSIILNRDSASPAVNDLLGIITFQGEDSASNATTYGQITGIITDPTSGSEDGLLRFQALGGGSLFTAYQIGYGGNFFYRDLHLMQNTNIYFEGSTDDNFETYLTVTDPTADRTITLPDATGTVLINSGQQTLNGTLTTTGGITFSDGTTQTSAGASAGFSIAMATALG